MLFIKDAIDGGFASISLTPVLSIFWIFTFFSLTLGIFDDFDQFLSSNFGNSAGFLSNMAKSKAKEPDQLQFSIFHNDRPIRIPNFHGDFPDQLSAVITTVHTSKRISMKKNLHLLSSSYKEIYYEGGNRVVTSPEDVNSFCHYDGTVDNDSDSYATLNLCSQRVKGTLFMDGKHFVIENSQLLPAQQLRFDIQKVCGYSGKSKIGNATLVYSRRRRALQNHPSYYKKFVTWRELYVELAIVFDHSMYKKYGQDKKRLFERAKELTNLINAYYQPVRIKVALAGVEIWSESDRVVINESGDATLDQFLRYRGVNLIYDIPNDHAQLLTNMTFNGGVVGKAMKGTMCSTQASGAVVMDHERFSTAAPIAATMAHEMGHNLGMEHDNDTCECPEHRCLMAASSSGAGNVHWSSCSMEYLKWSLSHGADYCLRNKPQIAKEPLCGNGFVEEGEDCDCGLPEACDNECCDARTCKFAKGAVCANGGCCDLSNCQYLPLASVCRESENECDLPEYCNGKSEACPKDTYKQNGIVCQGNKAFCYNGTCATHDDQCKLIWGPTGQSSSQECYNLNTKGNDEGHCGIDRRDGSLVHCENKNSMCGLLQCTHKTEKTNYGDRSVVKMTSVVLHVNDYLINCHTAVINLGFDQNPGLVPNGAKCGDGMMCRGQRCDVVSDVLAENPCPANCHDSGVCNNFGHCHCVGGYGGTDCSIPGLGGSIDSGPASTGTGRFNVGVGILIFLLVVLPLVTAVITFLYKKGIIKRPRSKIIDLLLKPARPKSRSAPSTSQTRTRTFDSATVGKKAPPIMAFPAETRTYPIRPTSSVGVGHLASLEVQAASEPLIQTNAAIQSRQDRLDPDLRSDTIPPSRPARPSDEILEKLYYNEVGPASPESFLSEVMTALEPDYGPAILPQRRAPPPPPPTTAEEAEGEKALDEKSQESKSNTVKNTKAYFEPVAERSTSNGSATANKSKGSERKSVIEISNPYKPKIGGELVTQASSLVIVPRLETQTLERKKVNDSTAPSSVSNRVLQMNQRKSSAIDDPDWRKRKAQSHIVQRSQSSVSGCRPMIAPPPPPIAPKPCLKLPLLQRDPLSSAPLVSNENDDVDSSSCSIKAEAKKKLAVTAPENYYDVIVSPVDEEREEIYADIDEFRATVKLSTKPDILPKDASFKA